MRQLANRFFNQSYALLSKGFTITGRDFGFYIGNTDPGTTGFKFEAYYKDWSQESTLPPDPFDRHDRQLELSVLIGPITFSLSIWLDGQMG